MRITFLLEDDDTTNHASTLALRDAGWLADRGHEVTLVRRTRAPSELPANCRFVRVTDFAAARLPDGDAIVATSWLTTTWIADAAPRSGVPVHLCEDYEGGRAALDSVRERIDAAYRSPGVHHLTCTPRATAELRERRSASTHPISLAIDHDALWPSPNRKAATPLRIGLFGEHSRSTASFAAAYEACALAHGAGQALVLVLSGAAPEGFDVGEAPFPIEQHAELNAEDAGALYRSLDLYLAIEDSAWLSTIEAMACGVPGIVADLPCYRDLAEHVGDDRYAMFVDAEDARAIGESIVLVGAFPDVRVTLRAWGIELARHFGQDRHGEQLEAALSALVSQAAPSTNSDLRIVDGQVSAADVLLADDGNLEQLCSALLGAARRHRQAGEHAVAARALTAARSLDTNDDTILLELADVLLADDEAGRALALLDEHAGAADEPPQLQRLRSNALHALGRSDEAAQAMRAAITAGERDADSYTQLGVALHHAGDVRGARESLERALVLDPGHAAARDLLAALPAA
ncbi:MAG: tetratricopeptide repeat protein [Planctomycetota bacterium]|nr:tetratricopeptide repeat protein [Planctomycetota bacterium]